MALTICDGRESLATVTECLNLKILFDVLPTIQNESHHLQPLIQHYLQVFLGWQALIWYILQARQITCQLYSGWFSYLASFKSLFCWLLPAHLWSACWIRRQIEVLLRWYGKWLKCDVIESKFLPAPPCGRSKDSEGKTLLPKCTQGHFPISICLMLCKLKDGGSRESLDRKGHQLCTKLQASRCESYTICPQHPSSRFPPTNFARDGWSR